MKNTLLFIFSLLLLYSCSPTKIQERSTKLKIVCTTGMIEDALINICDSMADVRSLMGPGVDPHLYKPSIDDLQLLQDADIIVYNGLHLEGKMTEIFEKLSSHKTTIAMASHDQPEAYMIVDSSNHIFDPHIWFDLSLWSNSVISLGKTLSQLDSVHADFYLANTNRYTQELLSLHKEVSESVSDIPDEQRILITAHDAFGYFGRAYGIEVIGLQGISTLAEFGLKDVTDLVNRIVSQNIKAIFIESSVPKKSIEAVIQGCRSKGHSVEMGGMLFSDAMGDKGTPEGTYIGMVRHNVQTIVNALR